MQTKPNLGGAVAIVFGPEPVVKTALVFDEARRNPEWKFPGGGIDRSDTVDENGVTIEDEKRIAVIAALRELEEETGLKPKKVNGEVLAHWIGRVYRSDKKGYTHYVFVDVDDFTPLKKVGNEGERTRTCTFEEIFSGKVEILKYHKDFLDLHMKNREKT